MPTDPLRLSALAHVAIEDATAKLNSGGSRQAWEAEMRRIIARAHTAAWLAGTSKRLKVPLDSPLLSQQRLSKAERASIKELVSAQLEYFKEFAGAMDDMSPEALASRANLYAGAARGSYYKSVTEDDLPCYPGGCPDCLSNCRCTIDMKSDGVYWRCADDDRSCAGCVSRGNDWTPYKGASE
jgi:hypothetical protein